MAPAQPTLYSLFIFDRHCTCVFSYDRFGPPANLGATVLPGVVRAGGDRATSQRLSTTSGVTIAVSEPDGAGRATTGPSAPVGRPLPFDEQAKLVYGVVLSIRNMVRRLAGRDEPFLSFSTSTYKLHYYETPTSLRFVMLTDPTAGPMRNALRSLYAGPYIEHVVRNPAFKSLDAHVRGRGIDCDGFRGAVETFARNLT